MIARARATCPELAAATGLSLVTVHKEVAELCRRGELKESGASRTCGGRPAKEYEYDARYARRVLVEIQRQGMIMRCRQELADMQGRTLSVRESVYAALENESMDGWLDETLRRQRIASIALAFPAGEQREAMRAHLEQRYVCPVVCMNTAEALAEEGRDLDFTVYLKQGEPPQCSMRRSGVVQNAFRADLLPLPSPWDTLDYTDHTLVEEMLARLLQIIVCTSAPSRIVLHSAIWTKRLTERIRFNTQSKLRGAAPHLVFRSCSAESARAAVRALAWRLQS